MKDEKAQLEIAGNQFQVEPTQIKKVQSYRVGDSVKVLKKAYGDNYKTYHGVVAAIDTFDKLPTVVVAYVEIDYNEAKINFAYLNDKTDDVEIAPDLNPITLNQVDVLEQMNRAIEKAEEAVRDLKRKKEYFKTMFTKHFSLEQGKEQ